MPNISKNFSLLSKDWYIVDRIQHVSFKKIINSFYDKKDFEKIHESFILESNQ